MAWLSGNVTGRANIEVFSNEMGDYSSGCNLGTHSSGPLSLLTLLDKNRVPVNVLCGWKGIHRSGNAAAVSQTL